MNRLALVLLLVSCRSSVKPEDVTAQASGNLPALAPVLVEASAPATPAWVAGVRGAQGDRLAFVGVSESPTFETAKTQADRDLLASIASYVAVDVQSELNELTTSTNGNEVAHLKTITRTQASAALEGIATDEIYWEKLVASPLATGDVRTRYYAHAWVNRAELRRARAAKQAGREQQTGRRTLAFLPLRTTGSTDTFVAQALGDQLAGRLRREPGLYVTDPAMVKSLVAERERPVKELVLRVEDALLSDVVLSGLVQHAGGRVRVAIVGDDARAGTTRILAEAEGPASDLLPLQTRLGSQLATALTRRSDKAPAVARTAAILPEPVQQALEARRKAWDLLDDGKTSDAVAAITRSFELAPGDVDAVFSMGRLLERLGRFARVPPMRVESADRASDNLQTCTDQGQQALKRARTTLEARAARLNGGVPTGNAPAPCWTDDTLDIDTVLDLAKLELAVSDEPWERAAPPTAVPGSAAEAYLQVIALARPYHLDRDRGEAELALADLAVRLDRVEGALELYDAVFARAIAMDDWHLTSLAAYGQGLAERKRGNPAAALQHLRIALVSRSVLGEKPYLLEIYSELAGVASELGRHVDATRWLDEALRLADQLGNDYLRTVLNNNRGVLDLRAGKLAEATGRFRLAAGRLAQLGETEGRIASGLNLATALGRRGESIEALPLLEDVAVTVEKGGQEGRLAELHLHRAELQASRGRNDDALESLATAYLLFHNLGRGVQAERTQASFLASERRVAREPETYECLKRAWWKLGSPVFPEDSEGHRLQTVPSIPQGRLSPQDLVVALDAAAMSALSAWQPPAEEGQATKPVSKPALPVPDLRREAIRDAFRGLQSLHESILQLAKTCFGVTDEEFGIPAIEDAAVATFATGLARDDVGLRTANATFLRLAHDSARMIEERAGTCGRSEWRRRKPPIEEKNEADDERYRLDLREEGLGPKAAPPAAPTARPVEMTDVEISGELVNTIAVSTGGEPAPPPPLEYRKPAAYERLLGAARVDADVLVLLDPGDFPALSKRRALEAWPLLVSVGDHFGALGLPREEALARLNAGALAWMTGSYEQGYRLTLEARDRLSALGDLAGLAHAYEWLGYQLAQSGEATLATQDWALAVRLYRLLGDELAVQRVLGHAR